MSQKRNQQTTDEARREFLRKSVYAAYATPVITALLVSRASAAVSWQGNVKDSKAACAAAGGTWFGGAGPNRCCNIGPNDGCGPDG